MGLGVQKFRKNYCNSSDRIENYNKRSAPATNSKQQKSTAAKNKQKYFPYLPTNWLPNEKAVVGKRREMLGKVYGQIDRWVLGWIQN